MSRLWMGGTPISDVEFEDELPHRFVWLGRRHTIIAIHNSWEVHQWADGIHREIFLVSTHNRLSLELFRDCLTDNWYVQRLYD